MIGKRVQFHEETYAAIDVLRAERRRSFQQLADEAFADLLAKHHHPADLKSQLKESTKPTPTPTPTPTKKPKRLSKG